MSHSLLTEAPALSLISSYISLARGVRGCVELCGRPEIEHLDVDVEPGPLILQKHAKFRVVIVEA